MKNIIISLIVIFIMVSNVQAADCLSIGAGKSAGIKKTEDHKKNLSKAHMGKKLSDEHKKSIGESCKGILVGSKNPMFGKTHSPEAIEKMREANLGENNYGWKGGKGTYLHQKAWEKFGVEYCEHCVV